MAGTWVKVYDTITEHPKCVGLSDAAWTLWIHGITYAGRNLSDGLIPAGMLGRLCGTKHPGKAAAELVDAGLWDVCDQGWMIHDYTEHQRTSEEVEAHRSNSAKGATKANHVRWHEKRGITDERCQWCISGTDPNRSPNGLRSDSTDTEADTDTDGDDSGSSSSNSRALHAVDDDLATELGHQDHLDAIAAGVRVIDPDAHRAACIQSRRDELAQPILPADAPPPVDPHADCGPECEHGWLHPNGPDGGALRCPGATA